MTDVIDAEAVEVPERGLTVPHAQAHLAVGVGALAAMSDDDFDRNLDAMRKGVQRAARMKEAIMVEDEDFGLIPGTKKPTLLKPGAEKLALAYGLTGRFGHHITYGHAADEPPITVVVDCYLHLGGHDGPVVAQGMGLASSFENRYRWRKAGRLCPDCGREGVIFTKGRGGQWWHPSDAKPTGGCGANFGKDDERLTTQDVGQVENPDPFELGNTLLKMAEKRAYVDAVLRATASSGLFSQDMEDAEPDRPPTPTNVDRETGEVLYPVSEAPPEPKVPWSEGPLEIAGAIFLNPSSGMDGEVRLDPTGKARLGFALALDASRKIPQVVAEGPLAEALFLAIGGNGRHLEGMPVTVSGEIFRVPWDKGGKPMRAFQRLMLARIETPDWTLPEPSVVVAPGQSELPL